MREVIRIVIVGSKEVGKSCLQKQMADDFTYEVNSEYRPTLGYSVTTKELEYQKEKITLRLFDSKNGQQSYDKNYYASSGAFIIVFDVTNTNSFKEVDNYLHAIECMASDKQAPKFLIGNTSLLTDTKQRQITQELANTFANQYGLTYMEINILQDNTSCKNLRDAALNAAIQSKRMGFYNL